MRRDIILQIWVIYIHYSFGYIHWVVTDNKKIQAQVDSIYALKHPEDLPTFLEQERRATQMEHLKRELLHQKFNLDIANDVKDITDIDAWFYKKDVDCQLAGKPLVQLDLYASTLITPESLGIDQNEHIPFHTITKVPSKPDCSKFIDVPISEATFDHLQSIKNRNTLNVPAENSVKIVLPFVDNVAEYGHLINEGLHKNKTSWILYDMATFYWRIKGEAGKAIECVRRSLNFSPRKYKSIALTNLANILNRGGHPDDALQVLLTVRNITQRNNDFLVPYMLGNIYALLTNYTESITEFRETLKLRPGFKPAIQRLHAVLCHNKLIQALEDQHNTLQQTLNNLQEFQRKHETWTKLYEKINAEIVPLDVRLKELSLYEELIITSPDENDLKTLNAKTLEKIKMEIDQEDVRDPNYRNKMIQQFKTGRKLTSSGGSSDTAFDAYEDTDNNIHEEYPHVGSETLLNKDQNIDPIEMERAKQKAARREAWYESVRKKQENRWHTSKTNEDWYEPPASMSLLADRRVVIDAELLRLRKAAARDLTTFLDENECRQLFRHFSPIEQRLAVIYQTTQHTLNSSNLRAFERYEKYRSFKHHQEAIFQKGDVNTDKDEDFFLGSSTAFYAPEVKGWTDTIPLLNDRQGIISPKRQNIPSSDANIKYHHPLPWYPPLCSHFGRIDCQPSQCYQHFSKALRSKIEAFESRVRASPVYDIDQGLAKALFSYINTDYDLNEDEVAQRILTAFRMGNEKNWALYNLAGLYWRIIGNLTNSIDCLQRSLYYTPMKYRHIPLFNMATLLAKNLGAFNHSLVLLYDALSLEKYDAKITLLLAHLNYLTGNLTGASHYYRETLFVDAPHTAPHSINKEALIGFELVGCRMAFKASHANETHKALQAMINPNLLHPIDEDNSYMYDDDDYLYYQYYYHNTHNYNNNPPPYQHGTSYTQVQPNQNLDSKYDETMGNSNNNVDGKYYFHNVDMDDTMTQFETFESFNLTDLESGPSGSIADYRHLYNSAPPYLDDNDDEFFDDLESDFDPTSRFGIDDKFNSYKDTFKDTQFNQKIETSEQYTLDKADHHHCESYKSSSESTQNSFKKEYASSDNKMSELSQKLLLGIENINIREKDIVISNPFTRYGIKRTISDATDEDCAQAVEMDFKNVPSTWLAIPNEIIDSAIPDDLIRAGINSVATLSNPFEEIAPAKSSKGAHLGVQKNNMPIDTKNDMLPLCTFRFDQLESHIIKIADAKDNKATKRNIPKSSANTNTSNTVIPILAYKLVVETQQKEIAALIRQALIADGIIPEDDDDSRAENDMFESKNEKSSFLKSRVSSGLAHKEPGLFSILLKTFAPRFRAQLLKIRPVPFKINMNDKEEEILYTNLIMSVLQRGLSMVDKESDANRQTNSKQQAATPPNPHLKSTTEDKIQASNEQKLALKWVLPTLASIYWRTQGNATQSLICLYQSLLHVPDAYKASLLISFANVCHRTGNNTLALYAIQASLNHNPTAVISHFTLANILAYQGKYENASMYYASTLALQDFTAARMKLQSINCLHIKSKSKLNNKDNNKGNYLKGSHSNAHEEL